MVLIALPTPLAAQSPALIDGRDEYFAGSELEGYLRTLQTLGVAPAYPWSLRKLSPREVDRLMPSDTVGHPWATRYDFSRAPRRRAYVRPVRPQIGGRYNSAFPWGINDGAVWAGRGATAWVSGGFSARWGAASLVVDPIAFAAQNADFPILDNGRPGNLRFGEARFSAAVDYPQRFGDAAYGRVDPGESTLRVDVAGVAAGASTAHEWWGPSQRFPFLLGNNAPGFPHLFVGSAHPVNLWLVKLHGRVLWGQLDQSPYFQAQGVDSFLVRPRRFATGFTLVLQPRGLDELELGLSRFVHAPWPDEGLPGRYITRSFEGIFKRDLPRADNPIPTDERSSDGENGLASVFGRFTVPQYGFEVYGEFGREDNPWDFRNLMLSPDEQSALMIGFAKAWRRRDGARITRLRAEMIDFQEAQIDLRRGGRLIYLHSSGSNQGHTQRGQLLGAGVGVSSAAGAFVAFDALDAGGRWTVEWSRIVRQDELGPDTASPPRVMDVVHSLAAERLLFRGGLELVGGAAVNYDFNHDFVSDRANASLYFSVTGLP